MLEWNVPTRIILNSRDFTRDAFFLLLSKELRFGTAIYKLPIYFALVADCELMFALFVIFN